MRITKSRLKEIIKEELQHEILGTYFANRAMKSIKDRQGDSGRGEGSMADSQLNRIADLATMIDDLVSDETNLEEWVESKITMAHAYLSAVLNYLKGNAADAREDEMGGEDEEDMEMYDDEGMLEEET